MAEKLCARDGCGHPQSWHKPTCEGNDKKDQQTPDVVCPVICEEFVASVEVEEIPAEAKTAYERQQVKQAEKLAKIHEEVSAPIPEPVKVVDTPPKKVK